MDDYTYNVRGLKKKDKEKKTQKKTRNLML